VKQVSIGQLDFDQDYEENKKRFIQRLVSNGWSLKDAEQEWNNIQSGANSE